MGGGEGYGCAPDQCTLPSNWRKPVKNSIYQKVHNKPTRKMVLKNGLLEHIAGKHGLYCGVIYIYWYNFLCYSSHVYIPARVYLSLFSSLVCAGYGLCHLAAVAQRGTVVWFYSLLESHVFILKSLKHSLFFFLSPNKAFSSPEVQLAKARQEQLLDFQRVSPL